MFTTDVVRVKVLGFPKPTITWKDKDGKIINLALSKYELLSDGSLKINSVNRKDSGKYTCHLEQKPRVLYAVIDVIAVSPPVILQAPHPKKRYVTAGYNTSFTCKVDGEPKPVVEWLLPSGQVVSPSPRYHIDNDALHIKDIQKSDKGKWTCKASVGPIVVTASATILDVYEAPKIYDPSFPWVYYPELFKEYTIACKASGYPKPTVIIRRNGRIHPRLDMLKPGESIIKFYLVRQHDLGNYSCEAWSNARDSNGKTIVVNQPLPCLPKVSSIGKAYLGNLILNFVPFCFKDKPVINPQGSPKIIYSYVGNPKPLMINCDFVSWPKANVTIWRGFYELTNGTDQATLYVWTYSWEDFGPYSCIGSNIYGEVNYTVWIKHTTPPGRPTNVQTMVSCDQANITWSKPSYTGGMRIERYIIKNMDGQRLNTRDWYPQWRVFGLTPNKEYTVAIRAMNRQGPGFPVRVVFRTPV
ncbi:hypothetical protein QZH41_012037, partial [Actinostola sp. cb2023]